MRSNGSYSTLYRVLLLAALALGLAACGDSEPDLEPGPDFSESPLQVKLFFTAEDPARFGEIVFTWLEIDGADFYRFYADEDGDSDGDGEFEFVQIGGDIPSGTDPQELAVPISVHLLNWQKSRFMLESCDAMGCVEVGRQEVSRLAAAYITGISGGGYVAAISETGDRIVSGLPATSVFECEEPVEVIVEEGEEPPQLEECEYTQDEIPEGGTVDDLNLVEFIPQAGSASVFTLIDGLWVQEALLRASNIGEGDGFGVDVAISDDGNTIVIAANTEDSNATTVGGDKDNDDAANAGAVYVLTRSVIDDEAVWEEVAYLKAFNAQGDPTPDDSSLDGDQFGSVVTVSGDGLTVAVSAFGEDSNDLGIDGTGADNSATNSGAVYVFRNVGGTWSQEAYVKPANTDTNDAFGSSLALSTDGSRLAVGAIRESSDAAGVDGDPFNNGSQASGAVYLFERSGSAWSQQSYIKAQSPDDRDEFGFSVALNGAGDVLVVGSPQEDSDSQVVNGDQTDNPAADFNVGAAYVFELSGGTWSQTAFLKAANADPIDEMGFQVAIDNSGNRILATSIREGGVQSGINPNGDLELSVASGAAYLFRRDGDSWRQQAYIKALQNSAGSLYGWDADFGADGERLVVTSFGNSIQQPTVYIH